MKKIFIPVLFLLTFSACDLSEQTEKPDGVDQNQSEEVGKEDQSDPEQEISQNDDSIQINTDQSKDPVWTVIPPEEGGETWSYAGDVEFRGWIEDAVFYVGDPEPHFRVIEEDIQKLPAYFIERGFGPLFRLYAISDEEMQRLQNNYSKDTPATIRVNAVHQYLEGRPFMDFVEIVE